MNLRDYFLQLCLSCSMDEILADNLWLEIERKYSEKERHYHSLSHLENMFSELEFVKDKILDFRTVSFSVFYHDVVYDATSKQNEEESAKFAQVRLTRLGLSETDIAEISKQILATKSHQLSESSETNYLLDADLSVLGKESPIYTEYTQNIRKEYSVYPDFLYKAGRRKVLKHFLELDSIFKTEYFKQKYEVQARENIESELNRL